MCQVCRVPSAGDRSHVEASSLVVGSTQEVVSSQVIVVVVVVGGARSQVVSAARARRAIWGESEQRDASL